MLKQKAKVLEIPSGWTLAQIENGLNNLLNQGWHLVCVVPIGTKVYAILIQDISK